MKKSRYTETQIIKILTEHENGRKLGDLIRPDSLFMWFLFSLPSTRLGVSTVTAGWLTSVHGSLQTTLPLASLPGTTLAHTGLSPFGTLNFMSYIHHSRHTHCMSVMRTKVITLK